VETFFTISNKLWQFVRYPLFELGGNNISVISIMAASLAFFLSVYLSKKAEIFTEKLLKERDFDQGIKASMQTFARYIVLITGILVTLDTVGISLNSLAALGAVLMVGIGFGLQNIAQNFISGLIILFERPIKKGDMVQVGDVLGRVEDIKARSTIITTRDDVAMIIPNSKFISEDVVNESFTGNKRRHCVEVGVAYGSDVEKVRDILLNVAKEHNSVLSLPEPVVLFKNFGDSSLDFQLLIWSRDLWGAEQVMSDLRFDIDKVFRDEKVTIPFPQRDLHIQSSQVSLHS